jgi:hypothetical protein
MKHCVLGFAAVVMAASGASAALTTYNSQAAFLAAVPGAAVEGFEGLTAGDANSLSNSAVVTAGFTVTPNPGRIGVVTGSFFGGVPSEGSNFLGVYRPGESIGVIRFDFPSPIQAFGFFVGDAADASDPFVYTLTASAGDAATPLVVLSGPPGLPDGSLFFFGFSQDEAFTSVTFTGNFLDDAIILDQVSTGVIPEPSAVAGLGVAAVAMLRRQRIGRGI